MVGREMSELFEVWNGLRQSCTISPLLLLLNMDIIIILDNLGSNVVLGANTISAVAYADNLASFGSSENEFQIRYSALETACSNFTVTLSDRKIHLIHFGGDRKANRTLLWGVHFPGVSKRQCKTANVFVAKWKAFVASERQYSVSWKTYKRSRGVCSKCLVKNDR